jgi:hypothetical protein
MSFISNSVIGLVAPSSAVGSSAASVAPAGAVSPSAAGDEFHAMVESAPEADDGVTGLLKSVDRSKAKAEGALMDVVKTGNPMRMYDATAAMAKFNTQTLVFSKAASKVGQAIDRLTNLQ